MRNNGRIVSVTSALVALALLTGGCTGGEPERTESTTTAATPSAAASPDPTAGGRDDLVESATSSAPAPSWDAASEQSALRSATAFLEAYLDTSRAPDRWLAGIVPHLDPSRVDSFSTVDPVNIPYGEVTGQAERVVDDINSPYLAVVAVPVDDTVLTVTLTRSDGTAPWLVVELAQG